MTRSAILLILLSAAQNARGSALFKRVIPSSHPNYGLYSQMSQVAGSVSLMQCAAKALKTWDSDLATPAANAFRHRKDTGVCDVGTVPNTEFGDIIGQGTTEDDEGIYVVQDCLEPAEKYTDAYILAPMVEERADKFVDSEKTERTMTTHDISIGAACTSFTLGAVFDQTKAVSGSCTYVKVNTMDPPGYAFTDATLMAWTHVTSAATANDNIILLGGQTNWNSGFLLRLEGGTANLHVFEGYGTQEHVVTGPTLTENTWTHIAATYKHNAGIVTFYVNGEKSGDDVNIGTVALASPLDSVGFTGCMTNGACSAAHAGIYKVALGPGDVKTIYERSRPGRAKCPVI